MIAIQTRHNGSAMDILSEHGIALVLGGLFHSDEVPVSFVEYERTSASSMVVRAEVVAEPVGYGPVFLVVIANDGQVDIRGGIDNDSLALEFTTVLNGRSFSAKTISRDAAEGFAPIEEVTAFAKALASSWLETPAGVRFHSGAMTKNSFGQEVDDVRVMDRNLPEAATPAGVAMVDYLSTLPESAVLLVVPVTDAGCEAFHGFASSFSKDGKAVARMENPMRVNESGSNIFLLTVGGAAVSV